MRKATNFCDYFVVCSGVSDRQVQSIAEGIEEGLKKNHIQVRGAQGSQSGTWVLLDMGDVVAHIFEVQAREFYGLEYLWQDAPKVNWPARPKKKNNDFPH